MSATTFTEGIQASLLPWAPPGSDFDAINAALASMFETVYGIVADQGSPDDPENYQAGWSILLDPTALAAKFPLFLPWCALFIGAPVPIGAPAVAALPAILGEQGFARGQGFGGTYSSATGAEGGPIVTAAQSALLDTQAVTLLERTNANGEPDPYHFVIVVKTSELPYGYDDVVNLDNPAPSAWWKLNDPPGSSTVLDSSQNGHTGTATDVTFGLAGPIPLATAASFNGTNSTIATTFQPIYSTITVAAWVTTSDTTTSGVVVSNGNPSSAFGALAISWNATSGKWEFQIGNGGSSSVVTILAEEGQFNEPGDHFLCGVWTGTQAEFWVDGDIMGLPVSLASGSVDGSAPFTIGSYPSGGGSHFDGVIAEVTIFPLALFNTTIRDLYLAGPTISGSSQLNAAVNAVKPAGVQFTLLQTSNWTISELEASYDTIADVEAAFDSIGMLEGDVI